MDNNILIYQKIEEILNKNSSIYNVEDKSSKRKSNIIQIDEIKTISNAQQYFQNLIKIIEKLKPEDKKEFFDSFKNNNSDFLFDYTNIYAQNKQMKIKNCYTFVAGMNYTTLRSLINKKLNLQDQKGYLVKDVSKLSLKERLTHKKEQLELNSKNNIYEDIKLYIEETISENRKNTDTNINNLYQNVVIDEVNDIMINNILDNKKIYVGFLVVRKERLNNFCLKLEEMNKKI
jgi:hypothetical protein